MDRQTRHHLKHNEFKDSIVSLEEYFKHHYKEVITAAMIVVVVVGLAAGSEILHRSPGGRRERRFG